MEKNQNQPLSVPMGGSSGIGSMSGGNGGNSSPYQMYLLTVGRMRGRVSQLTA